MRAEPSNHPSNPTSHCIENSVQHAEFGGYIQAIAQTVNLCTTFLGKKKIMKYYILLSIKRHNNHLKFHLQLGNSIDYNDYNV